MPVKKITKTFNYSKKDLIELVLKIEDYKIFLPWCVNSKILSIDKNKKDLKRDKDIAEKQLNSLMDRKIPKNLREIQTCR